MKLHTICNVKTLLMESEDGPIAAFILPSSTLNKMAPNYCRVHVRTGYLRLENNTKYVTAATTLEMDWAAYRYGAIDNLMLKRKLLAQDKLKDLLAAWLQQVPANNIKLYFGGDIDRVGELLCISSSAKTVPDKNIYIQTMWSPALKQALSDSILAENINIGLIHTHSTRRKDENEFPKVTYSDKDTAVDELHTMPKTSPIVWKLDVRCYEAFENKKPIIESLLI